jgi:hypothetical protein
MHPASLDAGADEHRADRLTEPEVGVGDDELDPGQAAGLQGAQEPRPERPVLAVPDVHPEYLAVPVVAHADGDHDGLPDQLETT